ncbi:MAG: DNA-directed RNA polymerase subunit beta, partial [Firmicutes bacterium]|nr:DNA-directed RNA polymerase subunit beta [Bacillota bacterium]
MCFSKIEEPIDIPYLIEVQKDSYAAFIKDGLREVFADFSPIRDYSKHFELYFMDHALEGALKYNEKECRDRDATYALPLKVKVRLICKDSGEVIDQDIFMGDFPLMTENGSFIINGAERVVVSQLVRSPGVYCAKRIDKNGRDIFDTTVIPNRGAWLEFEQDNSDVLWVHVDRTRKLTASVLLRSLGMGTDELLLKIFDNDPIIKATIEKDTAKTEGEALVELYKRLRPGEVPTEDNVKTQLFNLFFDYKRYDLAKVGRYKFNKKLNFATRLENAAAFCDIKSGGKTLAKAGEILTLDTAKKIQNSGINEVFVKTENGSHKVIGNNTVSFNAVTNLDYKDFDILEFIHYPSFLFVKEIAAKFNGGASVESLSEQLKEQINKMLYIDEKPMDSSLDDFKHQRETFILAAVEFDKRINGKSKNGKTYESRSAIKPVVDILNHKHITVDDIISIVSYNLGLRHKIGTIDNIDHLGNRRVRSVGELLQNQFRIGIARLERVIKERMATQEISEVTPQSVINIRPVTSAIKEFFGSSQLSQFMDQSNPIAELTHKRKLSALGPGGLNRDRATFDVRDVHHSHYGRMCPIETPEGQNIGLISSLSTFARINEHGFIESPYRKVDKKTGIVTKEIEYLSADEED